jgi:hypothetical protein
MRGDEPMALLQIQERRTEQVGKYRVTLLIDGEGRVIGALVEGPRLPRPVYIGREETTAPRIPKQVKKYLRRLGFKIQ